MPLYHYAPVNSPCKLCGEGFELQQPLTASALTMCATCGQAVVRKQMEVVHTPKLLKPLSVSGAKQLGFQVFKRTSGGEYERQ